MTNRRHATVDFANRSFGIDQKCLTKNAFLAEHLLAPRTVGFVSCNIGITQERKVERVLLLERIMLARVVSGYADDLRPQLSDIITGITEATGFDRATRGVIGRVKIQNDPRAFVVAEVAAFAS